MTAWVMLASVAAFAQQNPKPQQHEADSIRTAMQKQADELRARADSMRVVAEEMAKAMAAMKDSVKAGKQKSGLVIDKDGIRIFSGDDNDSCGDCDDDTTNQMKKEIKIGGKKKNKEVKLVTTNYLRTDLGLNNYLYNGSLTLPASLSQLDLKPGKSVNVNLHLFDQAVRLGKQGHAFFYYGVTVNYNNYRFSQDVTLNKISDSLLVTNSATPLKKDKLVTNYVTIPVGLRFETNPKHQKRSFSFAAGPTVGYLVGSHTKQVTDKGAKNKDYSDLNISKFRYGVNSSIGYGRFHLYVDYALTPLFEKGKGPELYPVSFGIVLNDFDF